ncbi:phage holin family protein [Sphingobium sp.]|uniref:phage holin family protein n=1 Tax=Sphingobium sp. TaxID=1912891 RepID=UPI003B3B3491
MIDEPADTAVTPPTDGQPDGAPDTAAPGYGVQDDGAQEESVKEVLSRLYADGRAYAAAEAEKQKLRATIIGIGVRNAAIFAVIALMLAFASIIALLVGLIIALSQLVAPIWATLIVVGGGLLLTLLLLLGAKGCISRMKKAIAP